MEEQAEHATSMRQKKALIALTITVLGSHSEALLYIMWFLWVLKKINNNYYSVRDRSRKEHKAKMTYGDTSVKVK